MNKKGMLDDVFDFIFTTTLALFILLFVMIYLYGGVDGKNRQSTAELDHLIKVNDYLVEKRFELEEGKIIDPELVKEEIEILRTFGRLPEPEPPKAGPGKKI